MIKPSKTYQKIRLTSMILVLSLITSISCQQEEAVQPQEDLPDLITALESFNEEVEYAEPTNADARKGPKSNKWIKKWMKKPTFFTLAAALKYTDLFPVVAKNRLTIFAPDDEAFAREGITFWNVKNIDKEALTNILLYHVTPGFVFSNQLPECSVDMLDGSAIGLKFMDGNVFIKDASSEFAQVIFTDKRAINSIFHGINKVLTPPNMTIAEIAGENASFSILVNLLGAANLLDVVADPDQNLTVFAPTDAAFEQLISDLSGQIDIVDYLTTYPEELTKVLFHHVAAGSTFSFCLADGQKIPTLNGDNLTVDLGNFQLISSSRNAVGLEATLLDIHANNGVIHAIDYVLIPENLDLTKPL